MVHSLVILGIMIRGEYIVLSCGKGHGIVFNFDQFSEKFLVVRSAAKTCKNKSSFLRFGFKIELLSLAHIQPTVFHDYSQSRSTDNFST